MLLIKTVNYCSKAFQNELLGPLHNPEFEASSDLYFCTLSSRFVFFKICFSVEKQPEDAVTAKRGYRIAKTNAILIA